MVGQAQSPHRAGTNLPCADTGPGDRLPSYADAVRDHSAGARSGSLGEMPSQGPSLAWPEAKGLVRAQGFEDPVAIELEPRRDHFG
jgi:hypothetical protein